MSLETTNGEQHGRASEPDEKPLLELLDEVDAKYALDVTPPPFTPHYLPSQGWAVCWHHTESAQFLPICHMRWTDGMRPQIEERIKAECELLAFAYTQLPRISRELRQRLEREQELEGMSLAESKAKVECDALRRERSELREQVRQLEAERDELQRWKTRTIIRCKEVDIVLDNTAAEHTRLQGEIESLTAQLAEAKAEIEHLNSVLRQNRHVHAYRAQVVARLREVAALQRQRAAKTTVENKRENYTVSAQDFDALATELEKETQ